MRKIDTRARFTLRIPTELMDYIVREADTTGVSANALIAQILWQWLRGADEAREVKA